MVWANLVMRYSCEKLLMFIIFRSLLDLLAKIKYIIFRLFEKPKDFHALELANGILSTSQAFTASWEGADAA